MKKFSLENDQPEKLPSSNDESQMNKFSIPDWLKWGREIQALAQTGLHYEKNDFQRERLLRFQAIASEIVAEYSNLDKDALVDMYGQQIGYATPRVDVRAAVFREGELLLVRERMDGGWTMPGGWADVGELPSKSAEREVLEEAGFIVKCRKVIGVYDANRIGPLEVFHAYKIVFLCDLQGGEAQTSNETTAIGFFAFDDLPAPLSGERTHPRHIQDAFSANKDEYWQTVFD